MCLYFGFEKSDSHIKKYPNGVRPFASVTSKGWHVHIQLPQIRSSGGLEHSSSILQTLKLYYGLRIFSYKVI